MQSVIEWLAAGSIISVVLGITDERTHMICETTRCSLGFWRNTFSIPCHNVMNLSCILCAQVSSQHIHCFSLFPVSVIQDTKLCMATARWLIALDVHPILELSDSLENALNPVSSERCIGLIYTLRWTVGLYDVPQTSLEQDVSTNSYMHYTYGLINL